MHKLSKQEREKLRKYLKCKQSLWNEEKLLWSMIERYKDILHSIPWIQAICICNSLAMNACHKNSDIDFFVITQRNRLWTARIYLTLFTSLLWVRKTQKKHAWKFCLSFFVSEEERNFWDIALKNDIYLSYWLETLVPVINKHNAFEGFLKRNGLEKFHKTIQSWVFSQHKTSLLNSLSSEEREATSCNLLVAYPLSSRRGLGWGFTWERGVIWRFIRYLWDAQEHILKKIFLKKTLRNYERLWRPFWVKITDTMLKFHDKDRRKEIRDRIL